MLCDICHTREAKIIYTEIINGQKREQHLCENCAGEQTLALTDKLGGEFPIGSILSGILQNYAKGISAKSANEPVCMRCGMTASELVKGGRVGCPECYNAFTMILDKNLRTVQGAVEHHGKEPVNARKIAVRPAEQNVRTAADVMREATDEIARRNTRSGAEGGRRTRIVDDNKVENTLPADVAAKIGQLKDELKSALEAEDYGEAARLRDRIRALEADEQVAITAPVKRRRAAAAKTAVGKNVTKTVAEKNMTETAAEKNVTKTVAEKVKAETGKTAKAGTSKQNVKPAKRRTKAEGGAPDEH